MSIPGLAPRGYEVPRGNRGSKAGGNSRRGNHVALISRKRPWAEILRRQVSNQLRRDVGSTLEVDEVVVPFEGTVDVPPFELIGEPDAVAEAQQLPVEVEL